MKLKFKMFQELLISLLRCVISDEKILNFASSCGYINIVKSLIENGYGRIIYENGTTIMKYGILDKALINASYYNHLNIVKYLNEHGAHMHAQNDIALIYASKYGNLDLVKYLLSEEANGGFYFKYEAFYDSIVEASENSHFEIIKYLIHHFTDLNVKKTRLYYNVLEKALIIVSRTQFERNSSFDIIKYLIKHCANYNVLCSETCSETGS